MAPQAPLPARENITLRDQQPDSSGAHPAIQIYPEAIFRLVAGL
jgi:hypothetical protein